MIYEMAICFILHPTSY